MPQAPTAQPAIETLFEGLRRLRTGWPAGGWSWDNRFSCISSSFSVQFESEARNAALQGLPVEWIEDSIGKAPSHMRELCESYGGLRAGQKMFTGGALEGTFAFGMWWPWRNGQTISMRVGLANCGRSAYGKLRDTFGVVL